MTDYGNWNIIVAGHVPLRRLWLSSGVGRHITRMTRIALHWIALFVETFGTLFLLLDVVRVNSMVSIVGYASFNGEPEKFHAWYYHCAVFGFALLFLGILVAGFSLLLEHQELQRKNWLQETQPRV